jgi:uncharacterized protein (TIGR02246 family)
MLIPLLLSLLQPTTDTTALRREIEQLNRGMEDAVSRGDLKAAAAFYADDAIVRTAGQVIAQGRKQVDDYFTGIAHAKSWKLDVIQVGGTRDHAWQVGRSTLVHGQPQRTSVVQFLVIWQRQRDGKLRVALDYYHSATPPRQAAAPASDTIRVDIGSPLVDGRVYKPHAARVRVWVGPGEGRMRAEWTNVLTVGDSAGKAVHRWVTTGTQLSPTGDTVRWQLRQTYDARTLQPYGIARTSSTGQMSSFRIDGKAVTGTTRANASAPVQNVSYEIERPGYVASASDLVPLAVGMREGAVILAPIWGPGMQTKSEMRVFTVIGKVDVNVEGTTVNAWKVEERKQGDQRLLATWWLLDKSPYMVYGEVPLPDGSVQRMTEIEIPSP